MATKRDLSIKEGFLEGNRQIWAAIFIICGGVLLMCQVIWHIDPTPYGTLLTFIGSFLIGGDAFTEFVKTKAFAASTTNTIAYSKDEKIIDTKNTNITENIIEQGNDKAPVNKPYTQFQTVN